MARLNYHHLYYFWRVAVVGKLTQVAQDLHISQSALSSQIKQLEENLEMTLFERRGRSLLLTESGRRVLAYANDIFRKGEELESFLRQGIVAQTQNLTIGILTTLSRNFIEHFVAPLLANPRVTFSLVALDMDDLLKGLAQHELDLVLTNHAVAQGDHEALWQTMLISRQPLAIIGPAGSKIQTPFPQGYEAGRWILPAKHTDICKAFYALCAAWQYTPNVQAQANDMAMLRLLVRDSGALAVLPSVVVKDEIAQGKLAEYQRIPNAFEYFYAITAQRKFVPNVLLELLQHHSAHFTLES